MDNKIQPIISPFHQSVLRTSVRCMLVAGGIFMAVHSLCGIVQERNNTEADVFIILVLFVFGLPGLSIVLASLFIEVDQEKVAKVFKLGSIWRWNYKVVRWDDVSDVEVYHTSRREYLNVEIKAVDGRLIHFSIPKGSNGAQQLKKLASSWKK